MFVLLIKQSEQSRQAESKNTNNGNVVISQRTSEPSQTEDKHRNNEKVCSRNLDRPVTSNRLCVSRPSLTVISLDSVWLRC